MQDAHHQSRIILDRRQLITGAAALGLTATLGALPAMAQNAVKRGGTLRVGMEGGSPSDSLDPRTYADSIPIFYSLMFWNQLVEIDAKGNAVPELAESWESKPGAAEWIFKIRKGITLAQEKRWMLMTSSTPSICIGVKPNHRPRAFWSPLPMSRSCLPIRCRSP